MSRPRRAKNIQQRLADAKRAGWKNWIRNEADERAISEGCYFDIAAAERVRDFCFDLLRHSKAKWAGTPFQLLDWQYFDVVGPLFGWKRADHSRRFRRGYVEIPKKNGKSTLCSAISLYMLVGDGEAGAEIYNCGAARDQAKLVFDESANMVEASEELLSVLKVRRSTNRILYPDTNSFLQAIAADAAKAEGKNAHAIICDELHAWRGREFYESLKFAGAARSQPLILAITTAGDDVGGVCYEEHERALRIQKCETFDSSSFGYVRAADIEDNWLDPKTWAKANPSLGVTLDATNFADDVREAKGSPRKVSAFKRYRLNIWVGASAAWLSTDLWDACRGKLRIEDFRGLAAWGGMDLSRTQDLSALVWIIPVDGKVIIIPRLFTPRDLLLKHEETDKVPYRAWVEAGFLIATDGDTIDYDAIRAQTKADAEILAVREIGYDPHNAEQLCNQQLRLQDGFETVAVTQSMANMGPPSSEFERLIKACKIVHPGNAVLDWMIGNTVVYEDTNKNIRPMKRKSRGRIDGVTSTIIGVGRAMNGEGGPTGSFYDSHDVELG